MGKLGGIWGENSRKPVFGFRLSGGKGILQRSRALIAAKIDQAEISDSEKSWLKKELGKIKDTALSTLTENAINAILAATLITLLKKFVGL
ncbi:hypothetical protein [Neisseria meningitidis]|uniref:hypothetical protein n=1 Tax=Neisseria meningitidis TaxID=487 RepID=UPI00039DA138|nr:hypothetical protein [Neisseria meningitidis]